MNQKTLSKNLAILQDILIHNGYDLCTRCEGKGHYDVPDGEEFSSVVCDVCSGSGVLEHLPF